MMSAARVFGGHIQCGAKAGDFLPLTGTALALFRSGPMKALGGNILAPSRLFSHKDLPA